MFHIFLRYFLTIWNKNVSHTKVSIGKCVTEGYLRILFTYVMYVYTEREKWGGGGGGVLVYQKYFMGCTSV
jgi:hypothetical protein